MAIAFTALGGLVIGVFGDVAVAHSQRVALAAVTTVGAYCILVGLP